MADAAILFVSSIPEEFKAGTDTLRQTKEHATIAAAMGITQLIVVCNKMNAVGFSEERFEEIRSNLSKCLKKLEFIKDIIFVPISGYFGDNVIENSLNTQGKKWT